MVAYDGVAVSVAGVPVLVHILIAVVVTLLFLFNSQ